MAWNSLNLLSLFADERQLITAAINLNKLEFELWNPFTVSELLIGGVKKNETIGSCKEKFGFNELRIADMDNPKGGGWHVLNLFCWFLPGLQEENCGFGALWRMKQRSKYSTI
jgi:hypothetical protein